MEEYKYVQVFVAPNTEKGPNFVSQIVQLGEYLEGEGINVMLSQVEENYCGMFVKKAKYYDAFAKGVEYMKKTGKLWNVVATAPYSSETLAMKESMPVKVITTDNGARALHGRMNGTTNSER